MIPAGRGDSIIACAHAITGQCCHLLFWLRILLSRLNIAGVLTLAGLLFISAACLLLPAGLILLVQLFSLAAYSFRWSAQ